MISCFKRTTEILNWMFLAHMANTLIPQFWNFWQFRSMPPSSQLWGTESIHFKTSSELQNYTESGSTYMNNVHWTWFRRCLGCAFRSLLLWEALKVLVCDSMEKCLFNVCKIILSNNLKKCFDLQTINIRKYEIGKLGLTGISLKMHYVCFLR